MEWPVPMVCPIVDMTEADSEKTLIEAARAGSEAAFAALIRRHESRVQRIAIRMLGAGDDADDVAQETFIRFHDALDRFRGDATVGTYVSRIAMNLSLNTLRRRRWRLRRFVRRDTDELRPADEPAHHDPDPALGAERRAAIVGALGRLSDAHRAVVVCRLLEEYSTRETALLLKIPEGTVMSRLTRALGQLRTDLRQTGMGRP